MGKNREIEALYMGKERIYREMLGYMFLRSRKKGIIQMGLDICLNEIRLVLNPFAASRSRSVGPHPFPTRLVACLREQQAGRDDGPAGLPETRGLQRIASKNI